MYDVLACVEKYGYADFQDFCGNLGYDSDSRKAEKIYRAVQREYAAMHRLFSTEELNEMAEIQ